MNTHLVFCYGSLKAGFHNHRLLTDYRATPLGVATTDGRYLLLKGAAFPFLIYPADLPNADISAWCAPVAGELYRVDDACLERLDRLEGHPDFYRRDPIRVNEGVLCWTYFLTDPGERGVCRAMIERDAARPDDNGVVEWKRDDVFAEESADD